MANIWLDDRSKLSGGYTDSSDSSIYLDKEHAYAQKDLIIKDLKKIEQTFLDMQKVINAAVAKKIVAGKREARLKKLATQCKKAADNAGRRREGINNKFISDTMQYLLESSKDDSKQESTEKDTDKTIDESNKPVDDNNSDKQASTNAPTNNETTNNETTNDTQTDDLKEKIESIYK